MKRYTTLILSVTLGLSLATGCAKEESKGDGDKPAAAKLEAKKRPAAPKSETKEMGAKPAFVESVMGPYEECRALLAADKSEGVSDCAKAMAAAAKSAASSAPDAAKEHLSAVGAAADSLAAAPAEDVEKLRLAYGDVSKSVVALLTATPAAAKDYHVFECPMAKGYKRWAQADKNMANPYMGTKMLECGSEVHDHHHKQMHH